MLIDDSVSVLTFLFVGVFFLYKKKELSGEESCWGKARRCLNFLIPCYCFPFFGLCILGWDDISGFRRFCLLFFLFLFLSLFSLSSFLLFFSTFPFVFFGFKQHTNHDAHMMTFCCNELGFGIAWAIEKMVYFQSVMRKRMSVHV